MSDEEKSVSGEFKELLLELDALGEIEGAGLPRLMEALGKVKRLEALLRLSADEVAGRIRESRASYAET